MSHPLLRSLISEMVDQYLNEENEYQTIEDVIKMATDITGKEKLIKINKNSYQVQGMKFENIEKLFDKLKKDPKWNHIKDKKYSEIHTMETPSDIGVFAIELSLNGSEYPPNYKYHSYFINNVRRKKR